MVEPVSYRQLGDILLRMEAITQEDLDRALARQASAKQAGQFRKLGDILLELGLVGTEEIRKALADQGRTILQCPKCSTLYNVDMYSDADVYLCQRCNERLVFPHSLDKAQVEDWVRSSGKIADRTGPDAAKTPFPGSDTGKRVRGHAVEVAQKRRREPQTAAGYPKALFGPYEILGEISRGGMGIIYKALHTKLDRTVAVKVLLHGSQSDAESILRFKNEARAVSRLRHPNIIGIHTIGEIEGVHYFSMDFIEGRTLNRLIETEQLSVQRICKIFCQISEAMTYAHSQGVLHRDLKPQNILVDSHNIPMVVDFGIAKIQDQTKDLTQENEILGSPAFLAPEYVSGKVPKFTESCDVYGVGACLYYTLVGRTPHDGENTVQLLREVAFSDPTPIRSIDRQVDKRLANIVMTAVAREPELRYKSFEAFERDLRRFLDGKDVLTTAGPVLQLWRNVRRPIALAFAVIICVALVFLSGIYTQSRIDIEAQAAREDDAIKEAVQSNLSLCQALIDLERLDAAAVAAQRACIYAQQGGLTTRLLDCKKRLREVYVMQGKDDAVRRVDAEIARLSAP